MADIERFQSANQIINRAAVLCGLDPAPDAFASIDPNYVTLRHLLDAGGQDLARSHQWSQLLRDHSFTTTGATEYDLPADFAHMIDQTGWQSTSPAGAYPLLGPATPQQWQYLVVSQLYSVTIHAWFRLRQGKLLMQPATTDIPVSFEYVSRGWVAASDAPGTYRDHAVLPGDAVLYEPILMVRRLRLDFLSAKGFDTTSAQAEYTETYSAVAGQDAGAPVLSMVPGRQSMPLITVPETGYG